MPAVRRTPPSSIRGHCDDGAPGGTPVQREPDGGRALVSYARAAAHPSRFTYSALTELIWSVRSSRPCRRLQKRGKWANERARGEPRLAPERADASHHARRSSTGDHVTGDDEMTSAVGGHVTAWRSLEGSPRLGFGPEKARALLTAGPEFIYLLLSLLFVACPSAKHSDRCRGAGCCHWRSSNYRFVRLANTTLGSAWAGFASSPQECQSRSCCQNVRAS